MSTEPGLQLIVRVMGAGGPIEEVALERVDDASGRVVSAVGRRFGVAATVSPADSVGRRDVSLEIESLGRHPVEAGIVVGVAVGPAPTPRWLIPGLFYGDNGPAVGRVPYPRLAAGVADPEAFLSACWSFRNDRAATPVVFGWGVAGGIALASNPVGPLGLGGVGFADAAGDDEAEVRLCFPFREEPVSYDGRERAGPPLTPLHPWIPGERVELTFAAYRLGADWHAYAPVLRDLHRRSAAPPPRPWVSLDAAADLAADGLLRWHWLPDPGVLIETAAFERPREADAPGRADGDRLAMHVAWLSGAPAAYALLLHGRRVGDRASFRAGKRVIDAICANLAPAGTFWGQWTATSGWGKGWTPGEDALHARTLAEATLFVARAVELEDAAGVHRPAWRDAVGSNLAFVAARQRADGALGSAYHGRTGAVESWAGSAGLAWVPALLAGGRLLRAPHLEEAARRAGAYYARFLEAELLHGSPEDVDLAPTSEDGYVAVMAYVALAESASSEGDRARWTDLARRAADWALTFRYTWNVPFAPDTLLGRYGYRTFGIDQASVANQHLHVYGLVCGEELARLSELTGDTHYVDRAREQLGAARQFIARFDGDFGARRGMAPERFFQTTCFGQPGEIGPLSHAWCLGLLLLAAETAPSIPGLADPIGARGDG